MGLVEEIIWGNALDCDNTLQWSNTCLNFTGDPKYSPILPWVSNITNEGNLSEYLWTYIENLRIIDQSEEEVWLVDRIIATYCTCLGIQYDTKNRRLPNKTPWTSSGEMETSQKNQFFTCVDQMEWEKNTAPCLVYE